MKPLVSIIIINWNGKQHLFDCLSSLDKIDYQKTEIILIDNGSEDGSVEMVKKNFSKVKIFANKKDLGFCAGNNQGYRRSKGKYVLLLNNDTVVSPDFLSIMVTTMEKDKSIGIIQPKIILKMSGRLQAGGAFFTPTGFLYHFGYNQNPDDSRFNQPMEIYTANGSCMLIRREVIEKIGFLDEDYFSYFEETDFCHRAWLAGFRVWYQPKAVIRHICGADNKNEKKGRLQYNSFRNRIMTYLKNLEAKWLLKILPVHLLLCLVAIAAFAFKKDRANSWGVVRALGFNLVHLPEILKKRKKIQQTLRQVKDNSYLPKLTRYPEFSYYLDLFGGLKLKKNMVR